jgi:hypothetical protein
LSAQPHAQEAPGLILQTTGDPSGPPRTPRRRVWRRPNRDHGGGFGLNIIDALALRWGVERGGGILVWVELGC